MSGLKACSLCSGSPLQGTAEALQGSRSLSLRTLRLCNTLSDVRAQALGTFCPGLPAAGVVKLPGTADPHVSGKALLRASQPRADLLSVRKQVSRRIKAQLPGQ